jgi:hypothetical protein
MAKYCTANVQAKPPSVGSVNKVFKYAQTFSKHWGPVFMERIHGKTRDKLAKWYNSLPPKTEHRIDEVILFVYRNGTVIFNIALGDCIYQSQKTNLQFLFNKWHKAGLTLDKNDVTIIHPDNNDNNEGQKQDAS